MQVGLFKQNVIGGYTPIEYVEVKDKLEARDFILENSAIYAKEGIILKVIKQAADQ